MPNDEITCRHGAASPEIVEGRKRNKGQVNLRLRQITAQYLII
jgi:hypothetical protein